MNFPYIICHGCDSLDKLEEEDNINYSCILHDMNACLFIDPENERFDFQKNPNPHCVNQCTKMEYENGKYFCRQNCRVLDTYKKL